MRIASTNPSRCNRKSRRRGAALVEFAVCLPILMILILGSMEASNTIFLKQSLHASAYEGIRAAVRIKGTSVTANAAAEDVLTARNIKKAKVVFSPASIENVARGERITIDVQAPVGANSPFIGKVVPDRTLTVRLVMIKE